MVFLQAQDRLIGFSMFPGSGLERNVESLDHWMSTMVRIHAPLDVRINHDIDLAFRAASGYVPDRPNTGAGGCGAKGQCWAHRCDRW